jgi:hypothetical protein
MAFNFSGAALPTYAAKDVAITQRPTSTAILAIDSEDRYKTYPDARAGSLSPYSFNINKAESLMNGFFNRLELTEVVFPWFAPDAAFGISTTTKQLFDLLGFIDGNNTVLQTSGAGGLTFCQATRYVDIVCTQLTNNQALKDTMSQEIARTVICRLYLGDANIAGDVVPSSSTFCPPGCAPFTIYRDYASPKQIAWMPNQPVGGFLRFEVYDDNGDLLTGSDAFSFGANRCDWSITMLVTEN